MAWRKSGADSVYEAAGRWVDSALRNDDSLFTPGESIWSGRWLRELHERFLDHPDESQDGFDVKLQKQLVDSPPEVYQLMGETLYVYFLIVATQNSDDEKANIDKVLGWSPSPVAIPPELVASLVPGLIRPGAGFLGSYRPHQVGFIIEFVEQWKQKPNEHVSLLDNPWKFKNFLMNVQPTSRLLRDGGNRHRMQREAILHLVFSDTFEAIIAVKAKEKIAKRLTHLVKEPTSDVDRKLEQIRKSLAPEYGSNFNFYEAPVKNLWQNDGPPPASPPHPPSPTRQRGDDLETLADELLFDVDALYKIKNLLNDKRQVIFQGPPGTGKTFVARKLAACLAGSEERVRLVQFHPSYAYEDFVQGFRPTLSAGQPGFKLTDGPLLEAAKRARTEPAEKHFLVIDEINRGNLAKVLGELYFLLEYRNEEMRLLYADKSFGLPPNLYIVGTMNTADRSIALVDLALRRRFHFVEFHPDKPPVKDLLRRWLEKNAPDMTWVADIVNHTNEKLGDRQVAMGPSYFMRSGLDEEMLRLIWEHNVLPYIEEHLYGEYDRLDEFGFDRLRRGERQNDDEQDADPNSNDAPD